MTKRCKIYVIKRLGVAKYVAWSTKSQEDFEDDLRRRAFYSEAQPDYIHKFIQELGETRWLQECIVELIDSTELFAEAERLKWKYIKQFATKTSGWNVYTTNNSARWRTADKKQLEKQLRYKQVAAELQVQPESPTSTAPVEVKLDQLLDLISAQQSQLESMQLQINKLQVHIK